MKTGLFIIISVISNAVMAYDMGGFVNTELQKTQANTQARELQSEMLVKPSDLADSEVDRARGVTLPAQSHDAFIRNAEPLSSKEAVGVSLERPQPGYTKVVDPVQNIQTDLAEKDKYEKQRRNYRNAVQKEFVRRAEQDGVKIDRNIAKEIEVMEKGISK